jgi:predicted alpha/beta-hydrolase family hydrolase
MTSSDGSLPPSSRWNVSVGSSQTSALWQAPAGAGDVVFVCAHGAGGHMQDAGVSALADALSARGVGVVRFNFLYREHGRGRPDPMPTLEACYAAVAQRARAECRPGRLVLGGRSMGGRAASMLVAAGEPCDGLLLLAYPLHPPGRPDHLRASHLPRIDVPVLCVNGTRDDFCTRALMDETLAGLGNNWQMRWLEGADHSFRLLKRSGRSSGEVLADLADFSAAWMMALPGRGSTP